MLELRGLTITTPARAIVRDLTLTLRADEVTALIGPSGCGKTSVLKWLSGILAPPLQATGTLFLDAAPITCPHPVLAYQPQQDALFPWLTIAQNAALGLEIAGLSRSAARARVAPLFGVFGLAGCEDHYPAQLSGGMRQRAAFLRTIVQDSQFVLLDEPFSALDAVTRLHMQAWLLARLAERPRGLLMVTHDLFEATGLADRILVMSASGAILRDIPVPIPPKHRSQAALATLRDTLKTLLTKDPFP
ncbi:Aliphatic sulfonates import ATP-binding protein SsuB [Aquimixticola soesokkakensis]|uniref:Aliphatic sulfonates import ATP-binding protein SsuB n=1 Tax=Aquimixticola soesokkakensis TaxID=1519096 RepID=A0A1Y5RZK6_9RHOB|nr:ABC transporter ATP-binding protein [Aquimixticola soesokkakensis]SLN26604.1 Aliphatic sulfonates import ATP-binding protein SsuB [Aquimixticola soesokkakensis]